MVGQMVLKSRPAQIHQPMYHKRYSDAVIK